jgi:hypothetical protein
MIARLLLCSLLLAATAHADDDPEVNARQMRKAGAGVMSVGVIHLGAGLALSLSMVGMGEQCRDRPFPCGEGIGFLFIPAISLVVIGGALTAVGMPLYFVGRKRERTLRAQPALIPTPIGQLTPVPPIPQ